MNIIINGDFLCRNVTGIERYAIEVCKRLDALIEKGVLAIYVPANVKQVPFYKHITVIRSKHNCNFFPVWEHIYFAAYVLKQKAVPLDFSNVTPLPCPGIVFIHDIYAKLYKEDFKSFRDKLVRIYACAMYRYAAKKSHILITVSDFSRRQLAKTYHIEEKNITVIPNGWDHFKSIDPDLAIFTSFPQLQQQNYFFSLGSLSKRKNLKWIADYASLHPASHFAISGKAISGLVPEELTKLKSLKNVTLIGYVSDAQVKALMQHCKAFVFPSYYEGFGIPPLEALSCNIPVIVAKAASLPELYGNCVHYINPDKQDEDLDKLLKQETEVPDKCLSVYTYDNAAAKLAALLKTV